jgi:hypothetical protein
MRRACITLAIAVAAHAEAQTLDITSLPPYGSLGHVTGQVSGVDPATHHVATYIQIEGSGWWTKPTTGMPTVPIAPDGSFSADVGTGGPASLDSRATIFCAALLPAAVAPPTVLGGGRIPASLAPLAIDCRERYARTLSFAGFSWAVKEAPSPVGPGGNRFSDRVADVFVDGDGLHLRVDPHDGFWWSTEVILLDPLGYGTYVVETDSRLDILDSNVTFGIFTWDAYGDDVAVPGAGNREIDFEDSRWGAALDPINAQWVVQPYTVPGNLGRYTIPDLSGDAALTRFFSWVPGGVQFTALLGHQDPCCFAPGDRIGHGLYLQEPSASHFVPSEGREHLRLNLWINAGGQPASGQAVEVVVSDVVYLPEPGTGGALLLGGALLAALARGRATQSSASAAGSPKRSANTNSRSVLRVRGARSRSRRPSGRSSGFPA